jgi:16S rRNA processing protein RimM
LTADQADTGADAGAPTGRDARICVGAVIGPHGVRGQVRIKSFTGEPAAIGGYGPVEDEAGRRFALSVVGQSKGAVIARLDGIADRDAAEGLKGVRLYVPRDRLPKTEEDEFLYADLVGLRAEAEDGRPLGRVRAVHDFGAGEMLDVSGPEGSLMVPFTRAAVPVIEVAKGRLVLRPPAFAEDEDEDEAEKGRTEEDRRG